VSIEPSSNLIRREDFPPRARHLRIFEAHLQTVAPTLRPSTVSPYRGTARYFLAYLQAAFPHVSRLSQLRRDPHLLGWFRWLCERQPPLGNEVRFQHLLRLRRLLDDLAANLHPLRPDLIRREDFPPRARHLPRPLSLEDDQRLQQELRRTDDLLCNTLLLMRATGVRLGECTHLSQDCLHQAALRAPRSRRSWSPADRSSYPRSAGFGPTLQVGEITRHAAPKPRWLFRLT